MTIELTKEQLDTIIEELSGVEQLLDDKFEEASLICRETHVWPLADEVALRSAKVGQILRLLKIYQKYCSKEAL